MNLFYYETVKMGYIGSFNKLGGVFDIPNIQELVNNKKYLETNINLINA